ncbi:hypothetical protein VNI00_007200 [Paramarasmius palmivorus]|uniref:Uncharacterized protein n=1 Tax=Paramarasmius palmivorus TaxID=297713 RepID=A0AAW0D2G6_9AGAR
MSNPSTSPSSKSATSIGPQNTDLPMRGPQSSDGSSIAVRMNRLNLSDGESHPSSQEGEAFPEKCLRLLREVKETEDERLTKLEAALIKMNKEMGEGIAGIGDAIRRLSQDVRILAAIVVAGFIVNGVMLRSRWILRLVVLYRLVSIPCDRQALVAANCASSTDWTCICTSATYQDTLRTCFEGCPQDKEAILGRQAQACGAAGLTVTNTGSATGSGPSAPTSSASGSGVPTSASVSVSTGPGLPSTSPTQTSGGVSGSGTSEGAGSPTTTSGATALNPSWLVMIGGIAALMMEV